MTPGVRRIVRFLLVGALNTAVGYGIYAALVLTGLAPGVAVAAATVAGCLFNFFSYGAVVFGGANSRRLPAFILFYASLLALNIMLLRLLSHWGMLPLAAQALLLPFMAAYSYIGLNHLVFRQPQA